jgi:hypothetical protein
MVAGKLQVRSFWLTSGTPTYFDVCARGTVIAAVINVTGGGAYVNGTAVRSLQTDLQCQTARGFARPGVFEVSKTVS